MKIKGQCVRVRGTTPGTSMDMDGRSRGRKSAGKFGKREEEREREREPSPPTFHKGMERKELFGPKLSGGRKGGTDRESLAGAGGENEQSERARGTRSRWRPHPAERKRIFV